MKTVYSPDWGRLKQSLLRALASGPQRIEVSSEVWDRLVSEYGANAPAMRAYGVPFGVVPGLRGFRVYR